MGSDLDLLFTIFLFSSCVYYSAHSIAMMHYKSSVPFDLVK
ncbi:hypothetical protein MOUN0_E03796 [Monosporozyma unispora]